MKKNYTISVPIGTFWTIIVPLAILLMIAGGICGVFILDRFVMPSLAGVANRGIVDVPNLVDMSREEAREVLYNIGLRLQVKEREYNDSLPKDIVISQQPNSREKVKKGRHVFVVVSKGAEVDTIPDIRNMKEGIGKSLLREGGFTNIKVVKVYSREYKKNLIIYSVPPRGTVISREIPIEMAISKGPRPTHAEVPNVIGEILSEAKQRIEEKGLFVGKIKYKVNTNSRPGSIISQSLSPGTNAPLESYINLVISASM